MERLWQQRAPAGPRGERPVGLNSVSGWRQIADAPPNAGRTVTPFRDGRHYRARLARDSMAIRESVPL